MNDQDRLVFQTPGSAGDACAAATASHSRVRPAELPVFGERQRREFEASPRPMRIFDRLTLRNIAVNDAALRLFGYSREEFLALTVKDTRHPEEHAEMLANIAEPAGLLMNYGPHRHRRKSGEVILLEIIAQDVLFNGRPARVNLAIDVTERELVTRLLRQREQQFETLAENLPDPVARFDLRGRYVYVNSAVEKLTGATRETLLGRTQRELGMPAAIVALFEHSFAETVRTGESHMLEFSFPKPSGERLFEAYHVPERNAAGSIVTVLCVARDITERNKAEEDARQQQNLLAAIIDNLPMGVFIRDAKTLRYVIRNRFCERSNGIPVESSIGLTPHDLFPKDQADLTVATDREALASGEMVERFEQEMRGRSGEPRVFHVRKVPLFGEDGSPWMVVGIAEDVTSRKRAEDERITHAIHQRDALVREVHHRIKNHLQGIAGLLRNKSADNPAVAETIEAAVAQLQSVAAIYGLQSELAESGVPLCRVLEAICSSAEGLSTTRIAREFAVDAGKTWLAETEAVPVAVALNELVYNAIEHGARRGKSAAIEVSLTEREDSADIRIVNRGRLPARFDYGQGIGTGTGLDLVRTLLGPSGDKLEFRAHDGRVEVRLGLGPPLIALREPRREEGGK